MSTFSPAFSPALFAYLSELAVHNDRDWFQANKARYEADLKAPCIGFIQALVPVLAGLAPALAPDPRPVGGSLFRIYRDTRFSKDKTPYKTHAGIHIRHRDSREDVHGPGLYLHLEPGKSMIGVGIWQPAPPTLLAVRRSIVADPAGWADVVQAPALTARFEFEGESLVRVPAGFAADHPMRDWLRRKSHVVMAPYTDAEVTAPDFLDRFLADFQRVSPYMRVLTSAVGLPWR